jgi:hypothetical protein
VYSDQLMVVISDFRCMYSILLELREGCEKWGFQLYESLSRRSPYGQQLSVTCVGAWRLGSHQGSKHALKSIEEKCTRRCIGWHVASIKVQQVLVAGKIAITQTPQGGHDTCGYLRYRQLRKNSDAAAGISVQQSQQQPDCPAAKWSSLLHHYSSKKWGSFQTA